MADVVSDVFGDAAQADGDDGSLVEYDVGNLYAFDPTPFEAKNLKGDRRREKFLNASATAVVKKLFKKILGLEKTVTELGTMVALPEPSMLLPREKPVPLPKKKSKWEKFAETKAIQHRKRERMVWDDTTKEWRPRWGYKREGEMSDWLVELKPWEEDLSHRERAKLGKDSRVLKNKKQQLRNAESRAAEQGDVMRLPEGIPVATGSTLPRAGSKERRGMKVVTKQLERAQKSTASMGKFDDYHPDEAPRKLAPKRRKFKEMHATTQKRDLKIMNQMFGDSGVGAAPEPERKKARGQKLSKKALAVVTSMGAKIAGAKGGAKGKKGKGKGGKGGKGAAKGKGKGKRS